MELLFVIAVGAVAWVALHKGSGQTSAPGADNSDPFGLGAVGDWVNDLEKKWEGYRANVYKDGAGNPTIGYGHKLTPGESYPGGIDEPTANRLLASDLSSAQAAVKSQVKVPLSDNQFSALVDWVFNLGPGRLKDSTLLQKLNAGDYAGAGAEIPKWDYVNGQPSAGVEARREDEVSLWNS